MNLNSVLSMIIDPRRRFSVLAREGFYNKLTDEEFLIKAFPIITGRELDLANPQSYNEKLQWLKAYYHKKEFPLMVDKYEVKKYVSKIIGEEYIIPTFGVWDCFDDIEFDQLPNEFVLKCTHDSGGIVIVKDRQTLDISSAKKRLNKFLKRKYYNLGREWPYKYVKPRIIAEKYMTDESGYELKDYKIYNFNGEPRMIQVDYDRFVSHKRNIYTPTWEYMDVSIKYPTDKNRVIKRPERLDEMLRLARLLSKDYPHLRTDFYSINEKVYFGELTFYPESGFAKFYPEVFEYEVGSWMQLPEKNL